MNAKSITRHANELLSLIAPVWAELFPQPQIETAVWTSVNEIPVGAPAASSASDGDDAADPIALPVTQVDAVHKLFTDLLALNIDQRWSYLAEHGYSEADLDILSATMYKWLHPESDPWLTTIAIDGQYDSAFACLKSWLGSTGIQKMIGIMETCRFQRIEPAICFALIDAIEIAQAGLRITETRRKMAGRNPEDWTTGAPEDFEEDLMLAEAGYDEEVASWPAY